MSHEFRRAKFVRVGSREALCAVPHGAQSQPQLHALTSPRDGSTPRIFALPRGARGDAEFPQLRGVDAVAKLRDEEVWRLGGCSPPRPQSSSCTPQSGDTAGPRPSTRSRPFAKNPNRTRRRRRRRRTREGRRGKGDAQTPATPSTISRRLARRRNRRWPVFPPNLPPIARRETPLRFLR